MWEFLNSKFGLLIVGFILTTILGAFLSALVQHSSWRRQTRLELFRRRYDEGTAFLNELAKLIGKRFFLLQDYLWAISKTNADKIVNSEQPYFESVREWNTSLRLYRAKLRLLVGEEMALEFLDYGDDRRLEHPRSLHYLFIRAHQAVIDAKRVKHGVDRAQRMVDELNWGYTRFIDRLTNEFLRRADSLELLEVPTVPERSNQGIKPMS